MNVRCVLLLVGCGPGLVTFNSADQTVVLTQLGDAEAPLVPNEKTAFLETLRNETLRQHSARQHSAQQHSAHYGGSEVEHRSNGVDGISSSVGRTNSAFVQVEELGGAKAAREGDRDWQQIDSRDAGNPTKNNAYTREQVKGKSSMLEESSEELKKGQRKSEKKDQVDREKITEKKNHRHANSEEKGHSSMMEESGQQLKKVNKAVSEKKGQMDKETITQKKKNAHAEHKDKGHSSLVEEGADQLKKGQMDKNTITEKKNRAHEKVKEKGHSSLMEEGADQLKEGNKPTADKKGDKGQMDKDAITEKKKSAPTKNKGRGHLSMMEGRDAAFLSRRWETEKKQGENAFFSLDSKKERKSYASPERPQELLAKRRNGDLQQSDQGKKQLLARRNKGHEKDESSMIEEVEKPQGSPAGVDQRGQRLRKGNGKERRHGTLESSLNGPGDTALLEEKQTEVEVMYKDELNASSETSSGLHNRAARVARVQQNKDEKNSK